jgi:hypothetical protein
LSILGQWKAGAIKKEEESEGGSFCQELPTPESLSVEPDAQPERMDTRRQQLITGRFRS